jgi:small subunit ribosomal protein S16
LEIDLKAYEEWIAKGAQPTDTVAALYKRFKSGKPFPEKKARLSKKAKAKLEAAEEEKKKPAKKTEA